MYGRQEHLSHEILYTDGWARPGLGITLHSQRSRVKIRLEGKILLPPRLSYPARLFLTDGQNQVVSNQIVVRDGNSFSGVFELTMRPEWNGIAPLGLAGDNPYSPLEQGVSLDSRQLLAIVNSIILGMTVRVERYGLLHITTLVNTSHGDRACQL